MFRCFVFTFIFIILLMHFYIYLYTILEESSTLGQWVWGAMFDIVLIYTLSCKEKWSLYTFTLFTHSKVEIAMELVPYAIRTKSQYLSFGVMPSECIWEDELEEA